MMDVNTRSVEIYENHNKFDQEKKSSGIYENPTEREKVRDRSSVGINTNPNGHQKAKLHPEHLLKCLGIICVLLIGGVIWAVVSETKCEARLGDKEHVSCVRVAGFCSRESVTCFIKKQVPGSPGIKAGSTVRADQLIWLLLITCRNRNLSLITLCTTTIQFVDTGWDYSKSTAYGFGLMDRRIIWGTGCNNRMVLQVHLLC
ncbi:transcript variant X2 [Nothobranchius furzeri]|uniref:Transcript variant X2 n=1 Tax=Nothobranchius furzeri TaxID=105023 RepID=A0A9D3BYR1_NOTFU|nr:transcript variant X2 [Nothobranchius furzeri]